MNDSLPSKPTQVRNYTFNQTLIIFPFILGASALAFYTTSDGFSKVLSGGWQYKIVSYAMSLFLVLVASFCSYQLGAAVANAVLGRSGGGRFGNRGLFIFVMAFALTASASGLFSYTFWHEQFYKLSALQIDARELPQKLALTVVMPKVNASIDDELQREATKITETPDLKDWINNGPNALVALAGASGGNFDAALRAAQEKAGEETRKRSKAIDDINAKIKKLDADLADLKQSSDTLQKVLSDPSREPALEAAKSTADTERQAADASKNGADSSKIAVCGPICLDHIKQQKAAEAEVARLNKALKPFFDQRAKLQTAIAEKKAAKETAADQVETLRKQANGDSSLPNVDAGAAPIRSLQVAIAGFVHDPRTAAFRNLTASCEAVRTVAKSVFAGRDDIAKVDCEYNGLESGPLLQARQAHLDALAKWKETCDSSASLDKIGGLPARIQAISDAAKAPDAPPGQSLQEARKVVEGCVDRLAEIGVAQTDISSIRSTIEDFARDNSLDRNEFERSMSDLRAFTPSARAGLLISAFIELSILIFKTLTDIVAAQLRPAFKGNSLRIVGTNDDPAERTELRVYKALYRNLQSVGGDSDEIRDEDIDSDDVALELRQGVRTLIARIARTGQARRRGRGYRISHEAITNQIEPVLAALAAESRPPARPHTPDAPNANQFRGETVRPDSPIVESAPNPALTPPVDESPRRPDADRRVPTLGDRLREQLTGDITNSRRRGR